MKPFQKFLADWQRGMGIKPNDDLKLRYLGFPGPRTRRKMMKRDCNTCIHRGVTEGMNTDCNNCKRSRLWTDAEQFEYIERIFKSTGMLPCRADHYICNKIPKGEEWTDGEKVYTYDGYSLEGENYDEIFHCFEQKEDNQ